MRRPFLLLLATIGLVPVIARAADAPASPGSGQPVAARVEALLARMTLAEKIGQLNLVSRAESFGSQLDRVRRGEIGLMLNVVAPDEVRRFQEAARASRLAIPLIMGLDAINV